MDLDECFRKGHIKKTRIDEELARSLIEMSAIKEGAVKTARITEKNVSAYVSMAYDSLREVMEAVCVLRGYKILSHLCLGELLNKILQDFDYNGFDRFRYIRNGINYYGTKIDFAQGKEIIKKMFEMKRNMHEKYLKGF